MLIKTQAFLLSVIKYNDHDAIVKTYTREAGFLTFFIKSLYKNTRKNLKKPLFQPNSILNIVATHRQQKTMEYIREVSIAYHYKNLFFDFDKLNQSTFLREILINVLQNDNQPNLQLFDFIVQSFKKMDQQPMDPDFHIKFLFQLTGYLGFLPDFETQGEYFDIAAGIFTSDLSKINNFFDKQQTSVFYKVLGMIFASKKLEKLSNFERQIALKLILIYYQFHLESFKEPKSLQILNDLYEK